MSQTSDPASSSLTGSGIVSDTTLTMSSGYSVVTDPAEGKAQAISAHVAQSAPMRPSAQGHATMYHPDDGDEGKHVWETFSQAGEAKLRIFPLGKGLRRNVPSHPLPSGE